jgi:hypothetical protein
VTARRVMAARVRLPWLCLGLAACESDASGTAVGHFDRPDGPPDVRPTFDDAAPTDQGDDAHPPADCPEVRFETPLLVVRACSDMGRVALATAADAEPFLWVEVGTEGLGDPLDPASLPGQAWRSGADGVSVRWTGENGAAPLGGGAGDTDAALSLDVRLEGAAIVLRAALRWPAAARFPGPYRPMVTLRPGAGGAAPESAYGQVVWVHGDGALVATIRPAGGGPPPRWTIADGAATLTPDASPGLLAGTTWSLPEIELDRGPTREATISSWAARRTPSPPPVARWGWRSGPAYGALISETVLTDVARALPTVSTHPPPLIVADGRWFDRFGADAPSPGFPDGLAAAAEAVRSAGGALGLRWAPLAAGTSATCPTCALDPRDPMVRTGAGRRAEALMDAGARALLLTLPPEAPPAVFIDGLTAITGSRALLGLPDGLDAHALSGGDVWAIAAPTPAPVPDACPDATAAASQDARCAEALRALLGHGLSPATATAPDPEALRTLASTLARAWPISAAGRLLDPGPVLVGDVDEAAARRGATLAALAGGLYLLGDPPGSLTAVRLDVYLAPIRRGLLRWPAARPLYVRVGEASRQPDAWVRPGQALALFNDGTRAGRWPGPAALAGAAPDARWVDVFSGQSVAADAPVEVPAGDVRVLVAPTADIE